MLIPQNDGDLKGAAIALNSAGLRDEFGQGFAIANLSERLPQISAARELPYSIANRQCKRKLD